MHISRLALDHFRSWDHCVLDLKPGVTILQGANGLGKTNLVEAVEVLSTGGSHRTSSSLPLVKRGETKATIRANVEREGTGGTVTLEATISAKGANRARVNGSASRYLRDIIGQIPSVSFAPDDQRLVSGDPAARRGFLDQAGALLIAGYARRLQDYTKIARQRAALLKQLGGRQDGADATQAALAGLEAWTGQFIAVGVALTRDRIALTQRLAGPFARIYAELAGGDTAGMVYEPSFDEVLQQEAPEAQISSHFQRIYPGEVARGQNLIGPHRDDVTLMLDGMPAREFASNGEMWTVALALRMAQYELESELYGMRPLVILDDVFAQLDGNRREQILRFAAQQDQVLITVASASDVPDGPVRRHAEVIDVAALVAAQQAWLHPKAGGVAADGVVAAPASPTASTAQAARS